MADVGDVWLDENGEVDEFSDSEAELEEQAAVVAVERDDMTAINKKGMTAATSDVNHKDNCRSSSSSEFYGEILANNTITGRPAYKYGTHLPTLCISAVYVLNIA